MNSSLVDEIADYFEVGSMSVFVHGHAKKEINEAAVKRGLIIRWISPEQFSLTEIWEAQRAVLSKDRSDPAASGFWTGLRLALNISETTDVLVFENVDRLDEEHRNALTTLVKDYLRDSDQGCGFKYVWATSESAFSCGSMEKDFQRHVLAEPKWLLDLETEAAKIFSGKLERWPEGIYACPWLRRFFRTNSKSPDVVFVMQDWGVFSPEESLEKAIEYLAIGEGDQTIKNVRKALNGGLSSGRICMMNAIWGLRKSGSKTTGYLSDEIHGSAFPIWITAVKELRPKVVCLCGEWAKWPDSNWGAYELGEKQLDRWKNWAVKHDAPTQVQSNVLSALSAVKFYLMPHPSAWRFSFSDFVKESGILI